MKMQDPKVKIKNFNIVHENLVEMKFQEDNDMSIDMEYISEVTAIFTTSNARMRLYDLLDWLHPSQLCYCDTDSVMFLYDNTNPNHKFPSNADTTLPNSVRFGDGLGEWKYELNEGEWITELVVGGAKSYSYKTNKGKIEVKQKGISLDYANSKVINFESIKKWFSIISPLNQKLDLHLGGMQKLKILQHHFLKDQSDLQ
jgi:hypothetical protein